MTVRLDEATLAALTARAEAEASPRARTPSEPPNATGRTLTHDSLPCYM